MMNNQLVLSWTNAGFNLQTAPAVIGPFTNLPAATSSLLQRLLCRRLDFLRRVVNDPLLAERRVRYAVQPRTGQFSEALWHTALLADENAQLLSEKRIYVTDYILCWCVLRERFHSGRWGRQRLIGATRSARNVRRARFLTFAAASHDDASEGNEECKQTFHKF